MSSEVLLDNPHEMGCTGMPHRKILMWAFLASDCMFFGSLISTYLVYRGHSVDHPLPEDIFDIPLTSTSSFVLLLSSWLMVLALSAIQKGKIWEFRLWTLGVAFFGSIFLGFQVYEFTHFIHNGLTLQQNLFGSTFFVLTGTHGCHVAIGVLWLMSLFFYSFIGGVTKERSLDVEIAGLYWHFVDIVWIVIFTAVYLLEYII
ncbi:MAG: cytochrome c oxidase subunit 3 [Vulcanimicrobiota bacterium]